MSDAQPFVFSVRPTYVERILDGRKRWEYRRRRPSSKRGDPILIYETAPLSRVVASARVGKILSSHMLRIWAITDTEGCVTPDEYLDYFDGARTAHAIELLDVKAFKVPLALPAGMAAPQSWARLTVSMDDWRMELDRAGSTVTRGPW